MADAAVTTESRTVEVRKPVLGKNAQLAAQNREFFQSRRLTVLNMVSSPGSGKTAILQRTIKDLTGRVRIGVVVGDLQTDNDARRLRESGAPAVQITTGTTCHLDAEMVAKAMSGLSLDQLDLLVIENVGNLVCPASYDLGEGFRVAVLSVTEGEDKPLKYPVIFKTAHVVLVNKSDIAEVVGFNRELALDNLHRITPDARIFEVSAKTGAGMEHWYAYLEKRIAQQRAI